MRNYVIFLEGPQIPKESIQNADDAQARIVKFCLDLRDHSGEGWRDSLLPANLADYQGPALLIYNDSA